MTQLSTPRASEMLTASPAVDEVGRESPPPVRSHVRPRVDGKFFFAGPEKLYLRGVTYGTFAARAAGDDGYDPFVAEQDFAAMRRHGINAVRLYSVPPRWLLDLALEHGLWVLAGIPWEQHITFLDSRRTSRAIEDRVHEGALALAGHPALLGLAVGNEVPAQIVRWHGARRVEKFIDRLCGIARGADPEALVTYVTYPSTEYLELSQLDFVAHNVYLEDAGRFASYVARLQTLAGDRPLVMAEVGLDSRRHGEARQAELLGRQVRATFERGAAGLFIFAWTDEWARTSIEVRDWDFGLTTRDRQPKSALATVRHAFAEVPFGLNQALPRMSVVVCTYNGSETIADCLDGLSTLDYPDYEVIVIDDGSTDDTAEIASRYDVKLVRTPNRGLSAARNEGLRAASGEIIAYIDDDAWPDRDWLRYIAAAYRGSDHVAIGGPNVPPPAPGATHELVARAPGGPIHVLRSDHEAEHIPGCNCSFRVEALRAVGGFDTTFRVAGDDVDVCWRLHDRGWTLGFAPAALVWHRRRGSMRAYLRQQRGYGKAEALLERKWPGRYNALGHVSWPSQLYGGRNRTPWSAPRPYHGTWGTADYQSLYQPPAGLSALPHMPEWYLLFPLLALIAVLGLAWSPLLLALPLLVGAVGTTVGLAGYSAARAAAVHRPGQAPISLRGKLVLTLLILVQPAVRLMGRIGSGLTPWRGRGAAVYALPRPCHIQLWSEDWQSLEARLRGIEERIKTAAAPVRRGGPFDRWDLEVRAGGFGAVRLLATVEEHGAGRQLIRFRIWPRVAPVSVTAIGVLALLAAAAWGQGATVVGTLVLLIELAVALRVLVEAARSMGNARAAIRP